MTLLGNELNLMMRFSAHRRLTYLQAYTAIFCSYWWHAGRTLRPSWAPRLCLSRTVFASFSRQKSSQTIFESDWALNCRPMVMQLASAISRSRCHHHLSRFPSEWLGDHKSTRLGWVHLCSNNNNLNTKRTTVERTRRSSRWTFEGFKDKETRVEYF